jgi:hypothetical protein
MKSTNRYLLPALALAVLSPAAWAEKEVTIRRLDKEGTNHDIVIRKQGEPMEKEKVTYLGVETAPVNRTLAAQLGLARDTGLVIVRVAGKSPAADLLKEDDVLTRLDDQILVNQQQLGVLVRGKKEGDEGQAGAYARRQGNHRQGEARDAGGAQAGGGIFLPGRPGRNELEHGGHAGRPRAPAPDARHGR